MPILPTALVTLAAALLLGQGPTLPADEPGPQRIRALIVDQEANGLPNQPTEDPVRQRIVIAEDRLLLENPQSGVVYLLRLDQDPVSLVEISHDKKLYREGRELDRIQHERSVSETQTLERLRDAPALERSAVMNRLFLRPGLEREVTVQHFEEEREILGRKAHRVEVRENGRVIVDAWIAAEDTGIPFFEFYRRVGAFSEEVIAKLRELKGLPLEAKFTVVTSVLPHEIHVRALEIIEDNVQRRLFEIPPGAEKIEESPFAQCPICGSDVEREAPPAGQSIRRDGTTVYFDRRECKEEYNHREHPERFPRPKSPPEGSEKKTPGKKTKEKGDR